MKVDRKEIKANAKESIRKHYFIFVISILFLAVVGVMYTSSTYIFSLLKGGNEEIYNEVSSKVGEAAYFTEDGSLVINNNIQDSTNDIAEAIEKYIQGKNDEALSIEERVNKAASNQPDEHVGVVTLGYRNGVLASLVNVAKSGSLFLTTFKSIQNVVKDPSVATVLMLILSALLFVVFRAFIQNALWLTVRRQFVEAQNYDNITPRSYLFLFTRKSYFRACITFFIKEIYQVLWGITIVGGIIKFFSYSLVSYIVAENPTLNSKQAITLSRKMMYGHKWELFVLELSFLGWELLNLITAGLFGLLYLNPYIEATIAQFYIKVRKEAIDNKIEGYELLNDKYLYNKASADELKVAYSDLESLCKNGPKETEKFTGVAGFFANVFGIVLWNSDRVKRISAAEEDALRINTYNLIKEGKAYPERLQPTYTSDGRLRTTFRAMHYTRRYSIINIIALFFIGCLVGWLWEVGIHLVEDGVFVNRGVLHGPWLPIYGSGAVMILIVLYRFRSKPWLEFLLTILLCGTVEYITSWILEITHNGQKWWDYTGYFLNINGRVCAEGLLVFGVAGIAFVYLFAPLLDNLLLKINPKILLAVISCLVVLFVADVIYSHFYPNTGKGITDYKDGKQTGCTNNGTSDNLYTASGIYKPSANSYYHYIS